MRVEGRNGGNTAIQPLAAAGTDAESRNIQNQIQNKQQELQKLSENSDMDPKEKMKKRQQIQQEISELNMQLRQHQIELRREQQNKAAQNETGEQQAASEQSEKERGTGMSQSSMQSMISADSSVKQAKVQGSVAKEMKGQARILRAEIKQDGAAGVDTSRKEEELAKTEKKSAAAAAAQADTLDKANEEIRKENRTNESVAADKADKKRADKEKGANKETENVAGREKRADKETGKTTDRTERENDGIQTDKILSGRMVFAINHDKLEADKESIRGRGIYAHMDVRL